MNNTVTGDHIKQDDVGAGRAGLQLDELVPRHTELLPAQGAEAGGAGGEVLAQHGEAGHDVSLQQSLQLLLVVEQTVECLHWDLVRTVVIVVSVVVVSSL